MSGFLNSAIALIAVINPVVCGVMLSQVPADGTRERLKNTLRVMLVVAFILSVAAIGGLQILNLFGIGMDAFQILGGVILTFIGFKMFGYTSESENEVGLNQVILFAASPGTIAMTITLSTRTSGSKFPVDVLIGIGIAIGIALIIIGGMMALQHKIDQQGKGYATQFMGLIVAGMGLQFILEGTKSFFMG